MGSVNVDTNVLIAYFASEKDVVALIDSMRSNGIYLYVSVVTETELLSYEGLSPLEKRIIQRFLRENFISVPYTRDLIEATARIRIDSKLKLPDAIIAATALYTGGILLTRNAKDFKKVNGLKIVDA